MKIIERFKWSCCCLLWEVLLLLKGTWIHPTTPQILHVFVLNLILLDLWQACTITVGIFFACVQGNVHGRMQDLRTIIHFQTDLVICVVFQIWFLCSYLRWKDSHRKSWPGEQQQYWIYIFISLMELISTKQKGLLALYPEYMSFSSNVNT